MSPCAAGLANRLRMAGERGGAGGATCAMPAAAKALRMVSDTLIAVGDSVRPAAANARSMVDEMELIFIGRRIAAVQHDALKPVRCVCK